MSARRLVMPLSSADMAPSNGLAMWENVFAAMLLPAALAMRTALLAGSVLLSFISPGDRRAHASTETVIWKVTRVPGSNVVGISKVSSLPSERPRDIANVGSPSSNVVRFARQSRGFPPRQRRHPAT